MASSRNPSAFTYLSGCAHGKTEVVLGDARLRLAETPTRFALIAVDAFSSDSIPAHLVTREAMHLYRECQTQPDPPQI